jgi:hypothetical protein
MVGVLCIVAGCAPKDPAAVALKVAQEWSADNVDQVVGNLAGLVAKDNPIAKMAASMAIKQEIGKRIAWEFSNPQKIGEEQYGVVATAYTVISVPVLGDYKISVNYNLEIDTKIKQVVAANMDASTFSLVKR